MVMLQVTGRKIMNKRDKNGHATGYWEEDYDNITIKGYYKLGYRCGISITINNVFGHIIGKTNYDNHTHTIYNYHKSECIYLVYYNNLELIHLEFEVE